MSVADRMMRGVLTLLAVGPWAWSVVVAELDRRQRVSLDDVEPVHDGPLVSVVVPARDEGRGVRAAIASLAAQEYRALEVLVVDDESSDATAAEARAAATHRVRMVEGRPVPTGWIGKSWACHQGYELAQGEWLLFTDADVRHAPDTVGRALALALRRRVAGVSVLPLIETGRETLRGWRKNTSAGLGGSVVVATVLASAGVATSLAPAIAIVRGPRQVGALGLVLQLAARAASDELCPTPRRAWALFPAGVLGLSILSLLSSVDRLRGGIVWRSRRYGTGPKTGWEYARSANVV